MVMADLANKVALVTGAGSGIGRATALLLAREGATVVVSDVSEDGGQETVRLITAARGAASFVRADVSKAEDCEALVRETVARYGALHLACNNAGIAGPQGPTGDYPLDGWQQVIGINLSGVFYCLRYQIPAMLAAGGGAIVNMASILGQVAFAGSPAYVAAKHGVVGLTQSAAVEYAAAGIRVNAVGPGFISTPLLSGLEAQPGALEQLVALHPIGRLGKAEEVAELVLWLLSDRASFVTGAYYAVDGGYLAR
jgi:NAD(P)-dependent dehydrogenase (short-subunit alcohol dehydrogenase family)